MPPNLKRFLLSLSPGRRVPRLVLGALAVGAITGLIVAGFEQVTEKILLGQLSDFPIWAQAIAPVIGLALSALLLRYVGGKDATTGTSDDYVKAYHDRSPRMPLRHLPAKLMAGAATMGFGGAMGLEGPSTYAGSSVGLNGPSTLARRWFTREEAKILMTAGAAAGVSAIFKAPATGVMFALESPYLNDVGRRALLPALFASAMSFLVFAGIHGPDPVFPALGAEPHTLRLADLIGGALIGIAAGVGGRAFSWLTHQAKKFYSATKPLWRIAGCGALLCGLVLATNQAFDSPLSLGPGHEAVDWALGVEEEEAQNADSEKSGEESSSSESSESEGHTPEGHEAEYPSSEPGAASDSAEEPGTERRSLVLLERSLWLLALLFALRAVATLVTVAGGGTGGLFIPLTVQGIVLGAFVGELIDSASSSLYPTLGLAAFLGAGYRTPIAAVIFVAESSRGSPFVVPALVAAAVSQLMVGRSSISKHQIGERRGHLERRLTLPISSALNTDVMTVPPDAAVSEFVFFHVLSRRVRDVPIVDGSTYIGMCTLDQAEKFDRDVWESTLVTEAMPPDYPTAELTATLRDAVLAMEAAGVEMLPVVDPQGNFVGTVSDEEIVRLDEILEETGT